MNIETEYYISKAIAVMKDVNEASHTLTVALINHLEDTSDKNLAFNEAAVSGVQYGFVNSIKRAMLDENMSFVAIDAIPGFTLTITKKGSKKDWKHIAKEAGNPFISKLRTKFKERDSVEYKSATLLLERFFERTGKKTVVLETLDVLFLLLPSVDFETQMKEFIQESNQKDNEDEEPSLQL